MSILSRLFRPDAPELYALWNRVAAIARAPEWYLDHQVPDTVDGRYDMVALVTALVLIELEQRGAVQEAAWLTERFVDDMDSSLRVMGVGDLRIGKHMGRIIGGLAGRLDGYRAALETEDEAGEGALEAALRRNVYRGESVADADALNAFADAVRALRQKIGAAPQAALLAGEI